MKYFLSLIISLLALQIANAQTAIYQDGVLSVPNVAVIEASGAKYYSDVQLRLEPDGNFKLMTSQPHSLVAVDSVSVNITGALAIQVSITVSGNKSVPCVRLLEPGIARNESSFVVALAESTLGPAETCIAMIDPFETTISLNVSGLSAGTYNVDVNGVKTSFELATDNP
ncbi:MAG: hypothetical protein ACI95C_000153 [Pseudohongiellaceae bacterium]|jgi:hypothetical protein